MLNDPVETCIHFLCDVLLVRVVADWKGDITKYMVGDNLFCLWGWVGRWGQIGDKLGDFQ